MAELNIGRQGLVGGQGGVVEIPEDPLIVEELIACFKRIKKSIEFWQKRGGRRQYYEFVRGFIQ